MLSDQANGEAGMAGADKSHGSPLIYLLWIY